MKIGIGIDTGGTYTDAVAYDFDTKHVLSSGKSLTTKSDLSLGIGAAIDSLDAHLVKQARIVSLSTTLATNACVENKGGRAKLIFIGVDRNVVAKVGHKYGLDEPESLYFLDCEVLSDGEIVSEPDWEQFRRDTAGFAGVQAVGIVELYAPRTGAVLEQKAKQILCEKMDVPVICGHELFCELNSVQRGASALLNARLIAVVQEFIAAIKTALERRSISAPIVIVRSDGTLMNEEFTRLHPVETLLCGPAASVMGAAALTGEKDSIIVDMGGTTTDIAIVEGGDPVRAKDGISVGSWRTYVKGLYIDTFGLGGDSAVRFKNGKLFLDTVRVVPLCTLSAQYPAMVESLEQLIRSRRTHHKWIHEFYLALRDITDSGNYSEEEHAFVRALRRRGPLSLTDAAAAVGKDIYTLRTERLEREGIVIRCGLTPTDVMHIMGDFTRYDSSASKLAATFIARCLCMDVETLCAMVYDEVKRKLYFNLVRILLENRNPAYRKNGLGKGLEALIYQSYEDTKRTDGKPIVRVPFATGSTLIGIGAPTHIFIDDVAKALGAKSVVPDHAAVANALGAIVCNIKAEVAVEVKPKYAVGGITGYTVAQRSGSEFYEEFSDALEAAKREAERAVVEEMRLRGAVGDFAVGIEVVKDTAASRDGQILLATKVVAGAKSNLAL